MTTKAKAKATQANYTADTVSAIVADYANLIEQHKGDNKIVLQTLSEKYGKSIHSIRAKLASLKAYKSANNVDNNAPTVADGKPVKKEEIANAISAIVGVELVGLEAATKAALQSLLAFLLKANKLLLEKEEKIESLISELLNADNA